AGVVVVTVRSVVIVTVVGAAGIGGVAWSPTLGRVAPSVTPVVITVLETPKSPFGCLSVAVTVPFGFCRSVTPVGGGGTSLVVVSVVVVVVVMGCPGAAWSGVVVVVDCGCVDWSAGVEVDAPAGDIEFDWSLAGIGGADISAGGVAEGSAAGIGCD